jgi:tetratricopeptide (TPR) repeat protein
MKRILSVGLSAALAAACSSPPASTSSSPAPAGAAAPTAIGAAASGAVIPTTTKSPEALAHFQKGEMLFHNLRTNEAAVEFQAALKLDPDFQTARTLLGLSTPGPDGMKEIETAAAAAGSLPEAERLLIEGALAGRRGELSKSLAAYARATEVAPGDWRGHYILGQQRLVSGDAAGAAPALKKAAEINPNAGPALNMLGYAALQQGDADGAIAAFQQYAKAMPQEPNPQDSLGEAFLAAGRFTEAEAAFKKALELSPEFWAAWEGIGYARAYAADWKGAAEAFAAAKKAATGPSDKEQVDGDLAAMAVARRDTKAALAALDAAAGIPGAQPSDLAFLPLRRAIVLIADGKYRESLAPANAALANAEGGKIGPGARSLRRQALTARITAEAGLKDAAGAAKTSAALDEIAKAAPDSTQTQSSMHYGMAMLAASKGDATGARAHFQQCRPDDTFCQWQSILVAERAGDAAGAAMTRDRLLKNYLRDPLHMIARGRLTAPKS